MLIIVGCASTGSVSKVGMDTYTVSAYRSATLGGITGARGIAVEEAGAFCAKLEKKVLVKNISFTPGPYADELGITGSDNARLEQALTCTSFGNPPNSKQVVDSLVGI